MIVATLDIEVKDTGVKSASGTGYQVDVLCVPQEDGGDTSGYTIPVNFYENGTRVQGTVTVENKNRHLHRQAPEVREPERISQRHWSSING